MNRHEFYDNLNKYKSNSLTHYGTLGQKWGVRKWQNYDGTFNEAGKERYFGKSSKDSSGDDKVGGLFKKKSHIPYDIDIISKLDDEINKNETDIYNKILNDVKDPYESWRIMSGIKADIAEKLKDKYSDIRPDIIRNKFGDYSEPYSYTDFDIDLNNSDKEYDLLKEKDWFSRKYNKEMNKFTDDDKKIILEKTLETEFSKDYKKYVNEHLDEIKDNVKYYKKLMDEGYLKTNENLDVWDIENLMRKDFKYNSTEHKLQTVQQTFNKKTGDCHDQTLFEMDLLKKNGYHPKALFLMEVDPKTGQGGQTHSFVYIDDIYNGVAWFENAWKNKAGFHTYNNINELKKDIEKDFGTDKNKYTKIIWGDFNGEPGDTLQEIVDKSLK